MVFLINAEYTDVVCDRDYAVQITSYDIHGFLVEILGHIYAKW